MVNKSYVIKFKLLNLIGVKPVRYGIHDLTFFFKC